MKQAKPKALSKTEALNKANNILTEALNKTDALLNEHGRIATWCNDGTIPLIVEHLYFRRDFHCTWSRKRDTPEVSEPCTSLFKQETRT